MERRIMRTFKTMIMASLFSLSAIVAFNASAQSADN
ncbi:MAG: hypothetical protein ACI85S_002811, partial [Pseudohongiellaceae bacterium]